MFEAVAAIADDDQCYILACLNSEQIKLIRKVYKMLMVNGNDNNSRNGASQGIAHLRESAKAVYLE